MPSQCASVGYSEELPKEFSFHAFLFKNEARKWQWQVAMNRWDLATKKHEPKHHDVLCWKHFEKKCFTDHALLSIQFGLKYNVCRGVHRVTELEKIPVWISKDEAPMPLPVVGPLFISPMSFHLSRALLGAWRFGLFRCVYSSFHNRLDLIREPAFYWVFYFIFPIYPCLFHHMWRWKSFVCSSSID